MTRLDEIEAMAHGREEGSFLLETELAKQVPWLVEMLRRAVPLVAHEIGCGVSLDPDNCTCRLAPWRDELTKEAP